MIDGTVISLPKQAAFSFTLGQTRVTNVLPNIAYEISYTITGDESQQPNIETIAPDGWRVNLQRTNALSGKIVVTTPAYVTDGKLLVLVTDASGTTLMQTVTFVKGNISLEQTDYTVESAGGNVVVNVQTDIDYDVNIATDHLSWITPQVDPLHPESFTLLVGANSSASYRYATVYLVNDDGFILEQINIAQKSAAVREIHVSTPGTLSTLVTVEELNQHENIKITGQLNALDYDHLRLATALKCVDLTDLDAETLPNSAFTGSTLQTVLLPRRLLAIPERAFYEAQITSLTIPEGVIEIGASAFYNCNKLQGNLVIPNSVETIGTSAFYGCTFDGTLTLSSALKKIETSVFENCSKFTGTLTIPDNVEQIADRAFYACSAFTTLLLNENLLSIGEESFQNCSGFTGNLTIPDKVQTIGRSAFNGCTAWKGTLIIGESVTSIDDYAFMRNTYSSSLYFTKIYFKPTEPPCRCFDVFSDRYSKLPYVGVPFGSKAKYEAKGFNSTYVTLIEEVEI